MSQDSAISLSLIKHTTLYIPLPYSSQFGVVGKLWRPLKRNKALVLNVKPDVSLATEAGQLLISICFRGVAL
jgi:hypothetical protein